MYRKTSVVIILLTLVAALVACAPAAVPTPTPTKAPAAAPTTAPAAAPTVAAQATKPPAAAPTAPASTPTPKPASLKFGSLPASTYAGLYIAIDKGYFKEQGITMEVIDFRNNVEHIAPLSTGQLDIVATPFSAALLAAADRGVEMKVMAGMSESFSGWETTWVLLRKDLADSGQVKTIADLKGMKVAIPTPGSLGEQTVEELLKLAGVKPGEVELTVLGPADAPAGLANKAVAAAYLWEPILTAVVRQGTAVKWIPTSSAFGGKKQETMLIFGPSIAKDQDLGRRFMIAYLKGVRDYLKAFTTKEGRQEAVNSLIKYTAGKDAALYDVMEMPYINPNGVLDMKSIEPQQKWLAEKGLYTGKKTVADLADPSAVEYAVQRLGRQ